MTAAIAVGFRLYDGIPVSDLDGNSMAILGHYDKETAFVVLDRHAREVRGWSDLYCGLPPAHSKFDDLGCHAALVFDTCAEHGDEPDEGCFWCDFIGGADLRLLLVEDFRPGAFPVMVWTP